MNNLKEMTLEELCQLFPITLSPHNPSWREWADEEIHSLREILSDYKPVISHIGSTAIPYIYAKPIVDILVELPYSQEWERVLSLLESNGYILMSRSDKRMSFNKGYTPEGYAEKVFHIHFHQSGDRDEIVFRDYLLSHPEVAKEYERLKMSLLPKYTYDRDGYTEAKSKFIGRVVASSNSRIAEKEK